MSGSGGGSAMVIAPLAFAAVARFRARSRYVDRGGSLVHHFARVARSSVVATVGVPVGECVTMMPFWLLFCAIAIVMPSSARAGQVAVQGRGIQGPVDVETELWKRTIPADVPAVRGDHGPLVNKADRQPSARADHLRW